MNDTAPTGVDLLGTLSLYFFWEHSDMFHSELEVSGYDCFAIVWVIGSRGLTHMLLDGFFVITFADLFWLPSIIQAQVQLCWSAWIGCAMWYVSAGGIDVPVVQHGAVCCCNTLAIAPNAIEGIRVLLVLEAVVVAPVAWSHSFHFWYNF